MRVVTSRLHLVRVVALTAMFAGSVTLASGAPPSPSASPSGTCPVTRPNGSTPPLQQPLPTWHGDGRLWVGLPPDGIMQLESAQSNPSGPLMTKMPWIRDVPGTPLSVGAHLHENPDVRANVRLPQGYEEQHVQATTIEFPQEGCWVVTGRVADDELTVTVLVVRQQ